MPDPHLNGNSLLHCGDTLYNPAQEVGVLLGHPDDRRGVELEVRNVAGDVRPLLGLIHKQVVDATDKGLLIPTRSCTRRGQMATCIGSAPSKA